MSLAISELAFLVVKNGPQRPWQRSATPIPVLTAVSVLGRVLRNQITRHLRRFNSDPHRITLGARSLALSGRPVQAPYRSRAITVDLLAARATKHLRARPKLGAKRLAQSSSAAEVAAEKTPQGAASMWPPFGTRSVRASVKSALHDLRPRPASYHFCLGFRTGGSSCTGGHRASTKAGRGITVRAGKGIYASPFQLRRLQQLT